VTHNDPTTTFSLCTFGQLLLQRHRLAMTLHQSLVPDAPLWAYQAFLLAPAGPEARPTIDIRRASLDDPRAVPLVPRVTAIKALAALLRFAYLADLPIHSVRILRSSLAGGGLHLGHLVASLGDGPDLELRLVGAPSGSLVLLQGGGFAAWFDPERWTALAPLHRAAPGPAPLSAPRRFSPHQSAMLRTLGAIEARRPHRRSTISRVSSHRQRSSQSARAALMRSPKVAKAVPGNCTPSLAASQDAAPGAHAAVAVPAGNCGHTFRWFRVASWGPIDVALLVRPIDTPV